MVTILNQLVANSDYIVYAIQWVITMKLRPCCFNCGFFYLHYIKIARYYRPVPFGHCRLFHQGKDNQSAACPAYLEKPWHSPNQKGAAKGRTSR